ncbi:LOW QUALITY PROTEIN: chaperone protein dnaJ 49-like [Dioscorea cayenensis subsp. rotundata]|uniref:LOW QUALITY PROTEIN: chaperone protein dnaJ 49-like n=1 Tax=Dioscorea cayennensis subsp. rotundata TaxID=55577 RepID=A0AB40B8Q3_DIOCR|nr:LOW QUALITY PROTEIN: chaperone protein dnaJ 49-like [Dioscorea cayenensis subsp. rotundata]
MDGNKDDALKCMRIRKAALKSGDKARALKFLSKARRLDPSLPIDELLSAASGAKSKDGFASTASSSTTAKTRVPSNGSAARDCTQEQIAIVREIIKQKDFYKILGLKRLVNCTIEDVRKAYRKLSLKVHPDKNNAPGSNEAFKVVSKAYQCLNNEESRKRYDHLGPPEDDPSYCHRRRATKNSHHDFKGFNKAHFDADKIFMRFSFDDNRFYEADVDADEIFRNFFSIATN